VGVWSSTHKAKDQHSKKKAIIVRKTGVLDKRVSILSLGTFLGGSLVVAVVAGVIRHRRAIKRLIEIHRM
jgi:hypothetical protein